MAEDTPTLNLKILSPSAEVEGGVTFPDMPASTSIKELRSRVQNAVPSRPAPDRMRLIYRGRVVANENDTLLAVFGADNLRESKDQSLHLVLRELPPTSSTSSSPGPRAAAQIPATASPPLQTNPFRTLPQPRPSSQPPQVPPPHHAHHHLALPLPPAIQQQLAQTMAAAQAAQMNHARTPSPAAANPPTAQAVPAPPVGAQAPATGLPPLPGVGPPNDGRPVRQEGVGPNGERWSVTYSSTTMPNQAPMLPRPFMHPPALGQPPRPAASPALAVATEVLLSNVSRILENARGEMANIRTLLHAWGQENSQPLQSSHSLPPWRRDLLRQHVRRMEENLNLAERALTASRAENFPSNPNVIDLEQATNELREHLEHINRSLGQQGGASSSQIPSSEGAPSILQSAASSSTGAPPHTTPATLPHGAPEELFLLSSPQGPVGILFDQRGTYMTAPMVPTLPFQTFTNQFAHNRQLIAGLGQHMMQNAQTTAAATASPILHTNGVPPTPTQPAGTGQAQGHNHAADQGQAGDQDQGQQANQAVNVNAPANPQGENDRAGNIAGHLWLVFKLACFVYFFSGTGWYKSLLLGLIAGGVYLAQIGMFEEQFNLIRRHFEAVLPVGALADQPAQPGPAEPRRNMTPEEAARRLLQQHQDQRFGWARQSMRTVERSFAIFVASLWPGIGERMVHAQEERARAERAAEEERVRLEEEERQKREEEAQQQQGGDQKDSVDFTEGSSSDPVTNASVKGKEKAETIEPDPVASGSSS